MIRATNRALPFSFLSAALALAGAAASGCNGTGEAEAPSLTTEVGAGPCALLECTSRVELIVRPGPPGGPAPERARACVDGRCVDLELGPGACGAGELCEASADGSISLFVPLSGASLEGSAKHLAALSLEGPGGRTAQTAEFRLIRVEPGGAACGHCYQAKVAFEAPATFAPEAPARPGD